MTSYLRHHGMLTFQSSRSGDHEDLSRRMPKISDETVTYTLSTRAIVLLCLSDQSSLTPISIDFARPDTTVIPYNPSEQQNGYNHDLPLKSVAFPTPSLYYSLPGTHPHPRQRPIDPPIPLITPSASLLPTSLCPGHFRSKIGPDSRRPSFLLR